MKAVFYSFLYTFIFYVKLYSQTEPIQQAEILIRNNTDHEIFVKVFPISSVFSGDYTPVNENFKKYSLLRSNSGSEPFWPCENRICGGSKILGVNDYCVVDFDDGVYYDVFALSHKVLGGLSFGLWKFEFYYSLDSVPQNNLLAECSIDYRDVNTVASLSYSRDIYLYLKTLPGNNSVDSLLFKFVSGDLVNIFDSRIINKTIKVWHQVGTVSSHGQDPIIPGSPDRGLFKTRPTYFSNFPVNAAQIGALAHSNKSEINMNFEIDSNGTKIISNDSLVFKNCFLRINSGITFTLENNSHLIFDGENSYLNAKTNSFITLGDNSSIEFKNGAHIKADGCIFTGLNSSIRWTGIKLSNTGTDTIINCKFNNAKTAITVTNNSNTIYNEKVIKNDTFNIPSGGNYCGINLSDCYNLNLSNNVFNMPTSTGYNYIGALLKHGKSGIGVIEVSGEGEGGGEAEGIQVLNVVNNTFNDGTASLIITNYTSNILQYYIYNNSFTGSDAANMILTKVVGTVKKNYLQSGLGGGAFV